MYRLLQPEVTWAAVALHVLALIALLVLELPVLRACAQAAPIAEAPQPLSPAVPITPAGERASDGIRLKAALGAFADAPAPRRARRATMPNLVSAQWLLSSSAPAMPSPARKQRRARVSCIEVLEEQARRGDAAARDMDADKLSSESD
jgi:hypothetical protein